MGQRPSSLSVGEDGVYLFLGPDAAPHIPEHVGPFVGAGGRHPLEGHNAILGPVAGRLDLCLIAHVQLRTQLVVLQKMVHRPHLERGKKDLSVVIEVPVHGVPQKASSWSMEQAIPSSVLGKTRMSAASLVSVS